MPIFIFIKLRYHIFDMKSKAHKAKRNTLFSAIISFISFAYKFGLGIYTKSLVLIVASISTLLLFVCKITFVGSVLGTREKKKKAYFIMAVAALVYSILFIMFVVLKVAGIDITKKNNYEGWLGLLFIGFVLLMFVLSIIKLRGALEKDDLVFIGLKEMTFISALTDLVIIQTFISRIVLTFKDVPGLARLDEFFPLAIGIFITIISIKMLVRWSKYEA